MEINQTEVEKKFEQLSAHVNTELANVREEMQTGLSEVKKEVA